MTREEETSTVQRFDVVFERAKFADGTIASRVCGPGRIAAISTDAP